jgi:23S rRNA (cytosine1962-C5)-methyltransferase
MANAKIILKPREELRIKAGHPWVYDNEISRVEGQASPGDEIDIFDARGRFLGSAFYNPKSKIRARIYSRTSRKADATFFDEALRQAIAWRRRFFDLEGQSLRLVFGEADGLPGLIVDSFVGEEAEGGSARPARGRWLSAQFLSLGVESKKNEILAALGRAFPCDGVMERSEAPVRSLEGLPSASGIISGSVPPRILMEEGGLRFIVDLASGQKTGWFLDQRANRAAAARYAKGARVLDAFCNAGGFAMNCAAAGASEVIAVDSSPEAVAAASANARLNGLENKVRCVQANAFDYLRDLERKNERFDMIILDPPAFAKNRASLEGARRGYKEINLRALRMLERGGILVTCSCSYWFSPLLFWSMLEEAALDSGRRLRVVEERSQDLDHPIVTGYSESKYLKCIICEVA